MLGGSAASTLLKRREATNPGTCLIKPGMCSVLYQALNSSSFSGGVSCPMTKMYLVSGLR